MRIQIYEIYSQFLWGEIMDYLTILSYCIVGVVTIIGIICLIYARKYGIKYTDIKQFTTDVLDIVQVTNNLKEYVKEMCIQAEQMFDNGEDKHNYVKACVYNYMKDTNYTIDENTIDNLIEEFITPTKQINYKEEVDNGATDTTSGANTTTNGTTDTTSGTASNTSAS